MGSFLISVKTIKIISRNLLLKERYPNTKTNIIRSIINKKCRNTTKGAALKRLSRIRANYSTRRLGKEEEPRIDYEILWVYDYSLTKDEIDKGYLGNYAKIEYANVDDKHLLVISKLHIELKYHPRRKSTRFDHPMPNMGHPLIRKIRNKGREYKNSIAEAKKELLDLSMQYEETAVLTDDDKLYLLIFSRKDDPKNPVQKWIMRISMDENDRPYLWMEKNFFEKPKMIPANVELKTDTENSERVFSKILAIPEDQHQDYLSLSKAFLMGFRDYDYRRLYRLRQLEESNHNVFFHFTSLKAFEAILESRRIWMTDLGYMNDISELKHGWASIFESFNQHPGISDDTSSVNKILERLDGPKVLKTRVFGFSFCEREELVNQWQAYGANGTGVAMGFDVTPFLSSETAFLSRVHYFRTRKIEKIQHIISALSQKKAISNDYIDYSAKGFNLLSAYIKHHAYYAENEWRLACLENPEVDLLYRNSDHIKYIPYYSFSFEDLCKTKFEEVLKVVIVGPLAENTALRNVRAQLDRHGFLNTEVKVSSLPLAAN